MENIRLGRGDTTDEEKLWLRQSRPMRKGFIQRLPPGYQTNIGETAAPCLAATSAHFDCPRFAEKMLPLSCLMKQLPSMDAESETLVQDALSVLLKDKTVMVIAHRMRTVANADKIVVLDDGKVSEMGTPAS